MIREANNIFNGNDHTMQFARCNARSSIFVERGCSFDRLTGKYFNKAVKVLILLNSQNVLLYYVFARYGARS
jgi:hypothetical protein